MAFTCPALKAGVPDATFLIEPLGELPGSLKIGQDHIPVEGEDRLVKVIGFPAHCVRCGTQNALIGWGIGVSLFSFFQPVSDY